MQKQYASNPTLVFLFLKKKKKFLYVHAQVTFEVDELLLLPEMGSLKTKH